MFGAVSRTEQSTAFQFSAAGNGNERAPPHLCGHQIQTDQTRTLRRLRPFTSSFSYRSFPILLVSTFDFTVYTEQ